jgi:hypothetical protein
MCTVSIVPLADGFRLVSNRDESRQRAIARPSEVVAISGVRVVRPIDPDSGGTWIAGSDRGLAFTVLNLNLEGDARRVNQSRSRGEIIPQLLACATVEDATAAFLDLPLDTYRPFRLIIAAAGVVVELRPSPVLALHQPLTAPVMFTSSGLGDHRVEAPRRELFDSMMSGGGTAANSLVNAQDRFHAHQWPTRRHISVTMVRPEASTVSRTVLLVEGKRVHMEYTAVGRTKEPVSIVELQRLSQSSR